MWVAAEEGIADGYNPVFQGRMLETEGALPEVSLRNLRIIRKTGIYPLLVEVRADGTVFFVFNNGTCYVATGFSVGTSGLETTCFAQCLITLFDQPDEDYVHWLTWLKDLSRDYKGRIDPRDMLGLSLHFMDED